jgi:pyruvate/2-oxoglutarate dehydrogenase complex dihydrolipoamide acyltransferase (E2) component
VELAAEQDRQGLARQQQELTHMAATGRGSPAPLAPSGKGARAGAGAGKGIRGGGKSGNGGGGQAAAGGGAAAEEPGRVLEPMERRMHKVLKLMAHHPQVESMRFDQPVVLIYTEPKFVKSYQSVITRAMDLGTVASHLERGRYGAAGGEAGGGGDGAGGAAGGRRRFRVDMELVFANAVEFNSGADDESTQLRGMSEHLLAMTKNYCVELLYERKREADKAADKKAKAEAGAGAGAGEGEGGAGGEDKEAAAALRQAAEEAEVELKQARAGREAFLRSQVKCGGEVRGEVRG